MSSKPNPVIGMMLLVLILATCSAQASIDDERALPGSESRAMDRDQEAGVSPPPGCESDGYWLNCSRLGLKERFGCDRMSNASEALAGLSPQLFIAECTVRIKQGTHEEGLVREGCLLPGYRNYVVQQNDELVLIDSEAEFRDTFAPVEKAGEAMSFVVALTDSFPMYDTSSPPEDYFPVVPAVEPAYSREENGAFRVHLFDRPICGCGTHPYFEVDYLVSRNGTITELGRRKVYDSSHQICFD